MSQYHEAILQLRNAGKEVVDFIMSEITAKDIKIARTSRQKNGIDICLSSKSFAISLGKNLFSRFGGTLKTSARLVGRKNGKDLYRVSIFYEPSGFIRGDVAEVGGKVIRIRNISRFISGTDLLTRKNVKIEAKGKKISRLKKYKTTVARHRPVFEVIHPETYQPVAVANPIETGKKSVVVVISGGKVYLSS